MKERFGIIGILIFLMISMVGCSGTGGNKDSVENISLSSESLKTIIETSRGESDNRYYSVESGDTSSDTLESDLGLLDLTTNLGISSYAISTPGIDSNDAYAVSIVETSKLEDVKTAYKDFANRLSETLYIEHYDKSQIAKDYKVGTIYNYCILVISPDATEIYEDIENKIIETISNMKDTSGEEKSS